MNDHQRKVLQLAQQIAALETELEQLKKEFAKLVPSGPQSVVPEEQKNECLAYSQRLSTLPRRKSETQYSDFLRMTLGDLVTRNSAENLNSELKLLLFPEHQCDSRADYWFTRDSAFDALVDGIETSSLAKRIEMILRSRPRESFDAETVKVLTGADNVDSVRATLARLAKTNKIEKVGYGQYRATTPKANTTSRATTAREGGE